MLNNMQYCASIVYVDLRLIGFQSNFKTSILNSFFSLPLKYFETYLNTVYNILFNNNNIMHSAV